MKSRHRRLFKWFLASSLFLALGLVYVQIGIVPGQLREKAILKLKQVSHQNIYFDKAVYLPFSGLNLYGVRWYKDNGEILFAAKRVAANVKWLPFFNEKKIIIDHFVLESPVYDWVVEQPKKIVPDPPKTVLSGQINVPVVSPNKNYKLEDIASGPDSFLPENLYLEQIEIINGSVSIRPTRSSAISEVIKSINIRMGFQKPPVIRFDGHVTVGKDSYASVGLTGNWDLKKGVYTFRLKTRSQKVPEWMAAYQKNNFLKLQKGRLYLETQIWNGPHSKVLFHTHTDLKEAAISVSPSLYQGHMKLEAEGVFDPTYRRFEQYKGDLELIRVDALNVSKQIDALNNLNGDIHFEKDLLTIRSIKGEYKKIGFEAAGRVRSFKELEVNGEIRSELSLDQVRALIPAEMLSKIKDFKIEGRCQTLTQLTGSLKKGSRVDARHRIRLHEGSISRPDKNIYLRQVSGDLAMTSSGLRIENLQFVHNKETIQIDGVIPTNAPASGKIKATSKMMQFHSDFLVQGPNIQLTRSSLRLPGASLLFRGTVLDWQRPHLELDGQALVDLKKSVAWAAQTVPNFKSFPIEGSLEGPFTFAGSLADWLSSDLKMDAKAKRVVLHNKFKFDNLDIQIRMAQKILNIPYAHGKFYGGPFGGSLAFDLSRTPTPFVAKLYANQVNLRELARDLPPSQSKLSGNLVFKTDLSGILQDRPSWKGQGALSITDGFIFQTDKFKAMGKLPLVKVEGMDWVTFHQLSSEFSIQNERIVTPKLSLMGDTVNLSMDGSIHFNGNLDLLMDISYSDDIFRGAQATGGIANFMVLEAGNFISQHRVRGTLKEPIFEKMLMPSGRSVGKSLGGLVQKITS
jgi:hypothetical protein